MPDLTMDCSFLPRLGGLRGERLPPHRNLHRRGRQPLAERGYRPLVLPPARVIRRTVPPRLAPLVPTIDVERRGLAAYRQLAEEVA